MALGGMEWVRKLVVATGTAVVMPTNEGSGAKLCEVGGGQHLGRGWD